MKNEQNIVGLNDVSLSVPAISVVRERLDRNELPKHLTFDDMSREADTEEIRFASEQRFLERHGLEFIPIEELADPDSLLDPCDMIEKRDQEDDEDAQAWLEANDRSTQTSAAPSNLPCEIQGIIRRYSLPSDEWNRISPAEREQRKRAIERAINRFYLVRAKHHMN
jgi:hypothetical protein